MSLSRRPGPVASAHGDGVITGLIYPLLIKATADYHTGTRRFGSARKGGRKHAGIDLYAPQGTRVRAMAKGKVLRAAPFYAGTWAIEIDHGSFIARYGEVDGSEGNLLVAQGDEVAAGEAIGIVGRLVGIAVESNMLHLELYSTNTPGSLTDRSRPPYQRRADLMDPTASIDAAIFP